MPILIRGSGGKKPTLIDADFPGNALSDRTFTASDFEADGFERVIVSHAALERRIDGGASLVVSGVKQEPRRAAFILSYSNDMFESFDISQHGGLLYLYYDRDTELTTYPVTFMFTSNSRVYTANLGNNNGNSPGCIYNSSANTFTAEARGDYFFIPGYQYLCILLY